MATFSWLDLPLWRTALRPHLADATQLTTNLRATYPDIRLFHACRPRDINTYYNRGIVPLSVEEITKEGRQVFLSGAFPELTEDDFSFALDRLALPGRAGRVYAALDARCLVQQAGHYFIYGAEFLAGLAAGLTIRTGRDYQSSLTLVGTPTLITLQVPFDRITDEYLGFLAQAIGRAIEWADSAPSLEVPYEDFTFTFFAPIPASCIFAHEAIHQVSDALTGRLYTHNDTLT